MNLGGGVGGEKAKSVTTPLEASKVVRTGSKTVPRMWRRSEQFRNKIGACRTSFVLS